MKLRNKLSKGFTPVLVVVIFTALAVAGYFLVNSTTQPSPPPTLTVTTPSEQPDDWITYTNEEVGFELKHPPGWVVKKTSEAREPYHIQETGIANWDFTQYFPEEAGIGTPVRISITTKLTDQSVTDYLTEHANYDSKYFEEDINVDGVSGKKIKSTGYGDGISIAIKRDKYIVAFHTIDNKYSEEKLNEILSTFEFTE